MAKLNFDVLFIDCSKSPPYNSKSLEKPLGGVESTVIRVAEGLGSLGLQVAVIKASDLEEGIECPEFEPIMGQHAFFMHEKELHRISTRYAVFLRGPKYLAAFPKETKKFIWCHDLPGPEMDTWIEILQQNNATVIGVSRWHRDELRKHLPDCNVTFVYNPVSEKLYQMNKDSRRINKDLMIWASSPHKDLNGALQIYKRIHEQIPTLRLLVFNPGYIDGEVIINPGVLYHGATKAGNVHHNMRNALCLFYPSTFQETFGLVIAEANALGCPAIIYNIGAQQEVVTTREQIAQTENEVISKVISWYKNGPPKDIHGKEKFREGNVIQNWLRVFAEIL